MAYVPTNWIADSTDLSAANLNKLEAGVGQAEKAAVILNGAGGSWTTAAPASNGSGSNNIPFVIPKAGSYLCSFAMHGYVSTAGNAVLYLYINGVYVNAYAVTYFNSINMRQPFFARNWLWNFAAGTYYLGGAKGGVLQTDNYDPWSFAAVRVNN